MSESDQASVARTTQSGSFTLELPCEVAFKLFTAAGERLWVPGWSPRILGSLPQTEGLVFLTGEGVDETIWTVLVSDHAKRRVRYSRVTPGSRAGTVEVVVAPVSDGSRVTVTYDMTALSPQGEEDLEQYSSENFRKMLSDWRDLIARFLAQIGARHTLTETTV